MASSSSPSRLTVGLAGFFLALIWFVPFNIQTHMLPISTFWAEWWAGALLLSAVALTLAQQNNLNIKVPNIVCAPVALVLVIAVQFAFGQLDFNAQFIAPSLYLIAAVIACCLGSTLAANGELERVCSWIALACLAGCFYNVGAQIAQVLQIDEDFQFISQRLGAMGGIGNINQVNHLASYLGAGLAAALYLGSTRHIGMIGMWSAAAFLVLGLVLTGQRSAMVYTLMPMVVTVLAWRQLAERRAALLKMTLALPVLFGLMTILVKILNLDVALPTDAMVSKSFYGERWPLWQHAMTMFSAHPWLGIGFDRFWVEYFDQLDVLGGNEGVINPHNLIAALLSETGLIGTFAVVVPLAIWAWRTRLAAHSMLQWFGMVQILNIGFHSMIEFPLWYAYFLIPLAFWMGAVDTSHRAIKVRQPQPVALLFLIATFIPMVDIVTTYRKIQNNVVFVGLTDVADVGAPESRQYVIDHLRNIDAYTGHWLFHREVAFWRAKLIVVNPDHLADKLAVNERAMKVVPNFVTLYRQVLLLGFAGHPDAAVNLLMRARQIYPEDYSALREALKGDVKRWPQQITPVMDLLLRTEPQTKDS